MAYENLNVCKSILNISNAILRVSLSLDEFTKNLKQSYQSQELFDYDWVLLLLS